MFIIVSGIWSIAEQINTSSYFHKDKIYINQIVKQPLKEVGMEKGGEKIYQSHNSKRLRKRQGEGILL